MKEGDIYTWRYKPERYDAISRFKDPYWCRSRIAVVSNGSLEDTYWGPHSGYNRLNPDDLELTFQGNPADMQYIPYCEYVFYKPEDIVDLRHSNNAGAAVYVKPGKDRDAETMREYYEARIDDADREMRSARERIERCNAILADIATGNTGGSLPVWTKHR
jgi:hypothetical protein